MSQMFSLFSSVAYSSPRSMIGLDQIVYQTPGMQLTVPSKALSHDAVRVESSRGVNQFVNWNDEDHSEAYELIQKVVRVWQMKGIDEYLVIGRESHQGNFGWDLVPFSKAEFAIWKQLSVMKRIFFGEVERNCKQKKEIAKTLIKASEIFQSSLITSPSHDSKSNDAFCTALIIDKQKIIDVAEDPVHLLYNFKPITYLHFLTVTKTHAEKFSEVSQEAYLKASQYAQQLIRKFGSENATSYLYHKTGKRAGQTVPHWHQHVVLPNSQRDEFFGKIKTFYRFILGASALSAHELHHRVISIREIFTQSS